MLLKINRSQLPPATARWFSRYLKGRQVKTCFRRVNSTSSGRSQFFPLVVHLLLVVFCGHHCTSDRERSVRSYPRWVLSRGGIYIFAIVICLVLLMYVYLDHLKFCVVCIDGRRYVCCSECNVVSNECNEPTPCLVQHIGTHGGGVMYLVSWIVMTSACVVNKQFKLFEFIFDSVYVDL